MSCVGSPEKRLMFDIKKLVLKDYNISFKDPSDSTEFMIKQIKFGPKDSLYHGGYWNLNFTIPMQYPFKSPSVGFANRIYHPNIDETSGSICLDVLNQNWSPMFDLLNIIEGFLPALLQDPNPSDPLNIDAAELYLKNRAKYEEKVIYNIQKYAQASNIDDKMDIEDEEDDQFSNLSDVDELNFPLEF